MAIKARSASLSDFLHQSLMSADNGRRFPRLGPPGENLPKYQSNNSIGHEKITNTNTGEGGSSAFHGWPEG